MEYVHNVPEESLSVRNVYIVFQRSVYLYGMCIYLSIYLFKA